MYLGFDVKIGLKLTFKIDNEKVNKTYILIKVLEIPDKFYISCYISKKLLTFNHKNQIQELIE